MNIFLIDVPLTNLKPALFLGKELEDMIHHDICKVALFHTNFTDPENEKVIIFCCRAEVDLSVVALVHKWAGVLKVNTRSTSKYSHVKL